MEATRPDISSPNLMLPCAVNRMFAPWGKFPGNVDKYYIINKLFVI